MLNKLFNFQRLEKILKNVIVFLPSLVFSVIAVLELICLFIS